MQKDRQIKSLVMSTPGAHCSKCNQTSTHQDETNQTKAVCTMLGCRKLIFTGPIELVGLRWGFKKQVFKLTVLLEYFDLT